MGCTNSKYQREIRIKEMKTPDRHRRHRRMSLTTISEPSIVIDESPIMIDDEVIVYVSPQDIMMTFKIGGDETMPTYTLNNYLNLSDNAGEIQIFSDQILIPLSTIRGIEVRDGILHTFREEEVHVRILARQLGKVWVIDEDGIQIRGKVTAENPWSFMISNSESWSVRI
jgi:hypothetical protein